MAEDELEIDIDDLKRRMEGAMNALKHEFLSLRTGRAAATMLDSGGSLAATKLLRFAVDRSFQGYGVGDRLMDHVFELARADGHAFVLVDAKHCSNATTYYRRLGFELVEHQDAVEGCDTMVARVPAASPTSQP